MSLRGDAQSAQAKGRSRLCWKRCWADGQLLQEPCCAPVLFRLAPLRRSTHGRAPPYRPEGCRFPSNLGEWMIDEPARRMRIFAGDHALRNDDAFRHCCIGWNTRGGFNPSGAPQTTIEGRNFTRSLARARSSWKLNLQRGRGSPQRLPWFWRRLRHEAISDPVAILLFAREAR